jgi:transcriptional regulator with XRE-family HTH domain
MASPSPVGRNIKLARQEKGMTQDQLAAATGILVDTIRKIEQGKNQEPRDLSPYVEALGWSETELRHGKGSVVGVGGAVLTGVLEYDEATAARIPLASDEAFERAFRILGTPERFQPRIMEIRYRTGLPPMGEATLRSYIEDLVRAWTALEQGKTRDRAVEDDPDTGDGMPL